MTQLAHVLASLWDRIKLVLVPPLFRLLIVAFLLLLSSASAQNPIGIRTKRPSSGRAIETNQGWMVPYTQTLRLSEEHARFAGDDTHRECTDCARLGWIALKKES